MKKTLILLLLLALLLPAFAFAEDQPAVINKIKEPDHPFEFAEDAQLLEIYFPRIDDCDAAFIRFGEYTMLLDGADVQWTRVKDLLDSLGVTEVTYAFASHPDTDHISGFQELLKAVRAEYFVHTFPEDYPYANRPALKVYAQLHEQGVPFRLVQDGDTIEFGEVEMTILQRWDDDFSSNNNSAMTMIRYGERSFLFAADVVREAQLRFVADQTPIKADILKFPHHCYHRIQRAFLEMIDPEMAVVTGGKGTALGVEQLRELGCPYYYTAQGVLRFATDGNVWVVERMK